MSKMTNKGVSMHCKAVTTNCFKVLDLLVEHRTDIEKPKGYLEASTNIRQPYVTLTSIIPVMICILALLSEQR